MIFSVSGSIQKIIDGTKTQTRRPTDRYEVGKTYAIQPGRGKFGIPDGRILILDKWPEHKVKELPRELWMIPKWCAEAEGGYTPEEYEDLYEKMYRDWWIRYAYCLEYVPNEGGRKG